jgi:GalNAc-alpha-(1->4)-GalNAc-alpha-(1->3)-diNAcBac-PP-undecaprenol alpha-1,4-N-acetyl-D-galactosaminyltransferase
MNITLVTASLQCGGAERVVSLLAQGFVDRGYQVQVVSLSHGSTDFYTLPVGVPVTSLDVMGPSQNPLHAIQANLDRFFKLRRAILKTKPDRIIAHLSQTNILSILATMGSGIPVYVTEHCDAELSAVHNIWEKLRRWVYPWATQVVSVSEGVDRGFRYLPAQKRAVLYNPVVPQPPQGELPHIPGADPHRPWVVTMGRLRSQKGYDLLIPAFAKLAERYPEWQLIIMGEGSDREALESLRNGLGLDDRVLMPGTVRNPSAVLHQAELFVMASRFEGFPMAHCEAMSSGLPIVSTDCESGPREIIRQNVDGFLVEPGNIDAIAVAMEKLMVNPSLRKQFAQRAPDILDRFGMDKIISQWEALMKITPEISLASYSQSSRYCNRSGPLTPNSGGT